MEILSLGEKIKRKRKEQNMTLKDLAGDKVTPGQISLVESGKSKPSLDLLEYIAEKMNVSIDYILETEEHQAEKFCEYYSKIAYGSLLAQNYQQAKEAISKAMAYADSYNLEYYKGLNELYNGMIEYGCSNYESAQERFILANEIFIKLKEYRDVIETYVQLGLTSYKLSYYNSSLNYFKQAERVAAEHDIQDDDLLVEIYFNISMCYSMADNHQSSVDYALLALEKYGAQNNKLQYGKTLLMLSLSYSSMNRQKEALEYADKAVQIFKELNKMAFVAKMETDIGVILSEIGNIDESFKHLQNAYNIKCQLNDKSLSYTMLRMVDNYIRTGDMDKAMSTTKMAYDKLCDEDPEEYKVSVYYYFYKLYLLNNDKSNAELSLLEAIKYLKNLDMPKELADAYVMLGDFYQKTGKAAEALECYNKSIGIYRQLGIIS